MDSYKTGRFIAHLRRERDLTQEALGELLGVSGKTVSRWERGIYMPDLSMLEALSATFSVTADELIAGERQSTKISATNVENCGAADAKRLTNGKSEKETEREREGKSEDAFTLAERIAYFKRKWRHDHAFDFVVSALAVAAVFVCGIVFDLYPLGAGAIIAAVFLYMRRRNEMMKYVEDRAFTEKREDADSGG